MVIGGSGVVPLCMCVYSTPGDEASERVIFGDSQVSFAGILMLTSFCLFVAARARGLAAGTALFLIPLCMCVYSTPGDQAAKRVIFGHSQVSFAGAMMLARCWRLPGQNALLLGQLSSRGRQACASTPDLNRACHIW